MRKITGVLIGITLLLIAGPASVSAAANNGTGDPLSLISGAVIQPFWNAAIDSTLIEVTSPVNDNGLELEGVVGPFPSFEFENSFLHVVYYDFNCARLISVPYRISYKGAIVFSPDLDLGAGAPTAGLAVITKSTDGFLADPIPANRAIHVRGHWYSFPADFVHEVDPIAGSTPQSPGPQTYSPLRSAASFGAPIQGLPFFFTTIYLVCPTSTVFNALPPTRGFPEQNLTPGPHTLLGYLYDDRERKILDYTVFCTCISMYSLEQLSPLYGSALQLPGDLSYTELVSYEPPTGAITDPGPPIEVATQAPPAEATNPRAFVAYRQIFINSIFWPGGSGDDFGRTNNGSAYNYRVNLSDPFVPNPPRFVPGLR
jgi:hypothetical protein